MTLTPHAASCAISGTEEGRPDRPTDRDRKARAGADWLKGMRSIYNGQVV